jgi:hypothetical protein
LYGVKKHKGGKQMGLFNKKSTEQIQEENRLLKERSIARDIARSEKAEDKALRRQAKRENIALKNPKKIRFVKKVGSGAKDLGKGVLWGINKAGEQYAKAQASKQPQSRRVRKVKKVQKKKKTGGLTYNLTYTPQESTPKKKRKVKRVRKVKKRSLSSQFGVEPRFRF